MKRSTRVVSAVASAWLASHAAAQADLVKPSEPETAKSIPAKEATAQQNQTVLTIKEDGSLVMNTKPLTLDEVSTKLTALARIDKDYAIILRMDEKLPYKHVARVLDTCRGAGISNVAFSAAKKSE